MLIMHQLVTSSVGLVACFIALATAYPAFDTVDTSFPAYPFAREELSVRTSSRNSVLGLLGRQGCPNFTTNCGTICCGYDNPCCGDSCCGNGYVCLDSAPCCVAIDAQTNQCGDSGGTDVCSGAPEGYTQCTNGLNFCCPSGATCFLDANGYPGCASPNPCAGLPSNYEPCINGLTFCCPGGNGCYVDAYNEPICGSGDVTTSYPPPPSTTSLYYPPDAPVTSNPVVVTVPGPNPTVTVVSISDHYVEHDPGFWTTGHIAAIAGGVGGGVLIIALAIIIPCCIHHVRKKRREREYRPDPRASPLSDQKIYNSVSDLTTSGGWQLFYTHEARRMSLVPHVDKLSWMQDVCTRAVAIRAGQIRSSDDKKVTLWKAAAVSSNIVGKLWKWATGYDANKNFNTICLHALGLGDEDTLKELLALAKAAGDGKPTTWKMKIKSQVESGVRTVAKKAFKHWWNGTSDLASEAHAELADVLTQEFGEHVATEMMDLLVMHIPGLGLLIKGTKGALESNDKINRAVSWMADLALEIHLAVFVMNALEELEEGSYEKGEGETYIRVNRKN